MRSKVTSQDVVLIRVCHILSGDLWAGAEVMAYHLVKGLKSYSDLDIFVILLNRGKLADEIKRLGIRHYLVEEKKFSLYRTVLKLKELLRESSPHLIHSHRYKENLLGYLCANANERTRFVSTQHGMPEFVGPKASLKHRILMRLNFLLLAKCFHKVAVVSSDLKKRLVKEWQFSDGKIEIIPNGTPVEAPPRVRNSDRFVIGSCGRLVPVKNFPFMVEVARGVAKRSDHIRFELAGEGPEANRIRDLVKEYGLEDCFQLCGFIEDTESFYSGLDLYLNTSIHEGIPMSVLEAMAHAIPVIAPDVGGLSEIIQDGVEGYLIKDLEPNAFAQKCLKLFSNEGLRAKMAEATRRRASNDFSIDQMARRYYWLYQNQLNQLNELHTKDGQRVG